MWVFIALVCLSSSWPNGCYPSEAKTADAGMVYSDRKACLEVMRMFRVERFVDGNYTIYGCYKLPDKDEDEDGKSDHHLSRRAP